MIVPTEEIREQTDVQVEESEQIRHSGVNCMDIFREWVHLKTPKGCSHINATWAEERGKATRKKDDASIPNLKLWSGVAAKDQDAGRNKAKSPILFPSRGKGDDDDDVFTIQQ